MSMIGDVPIFFEKGDVKIYLEKLEHFFEANEIAEEKKKAILLIDEYTYKLLRNVCHPLQPKNKTYEELVELLKKHYVVRTSVFRERVKFYAARQYATESIFRWFIRVKKLSVDCKFGNNFDDIVLDRFISGLRRSRILDRLCEEDNTLTLKQAIDIAVNEERALKGCNESDDDTESE